MDWREKRTQRKVRNQLPLVAYSLNCGHLGKQYGIVKGDHVFCEECAADKRVARILAQ